MEGIRVRHLLPKERMLLSPPPPPPPPTPTPRTISHPVCSTQAHCQPSGPAERASLSIALAHPARSPGSPPSLVARLARTTAATRGGSSQVLRGRGHKRYRSLALLKETVGALQRALATSTEGERHDIHRGKRRDAVRTATSCP